MADPQQRSGAPVGLPGPLGGRGRRRQQLHTVGVELPTGRQQRDTAPVAVEQHDAEVALQRPDRHAQRLLGQLEPPGRARHGPLLDDRDEMRDLAQVELRHGAPSRSSSVAITVAHPAEPGKAERITIGPVRGAAALIGGVPPARDLWQAAGMQAREIRRAYLDMLVAHGHVIIPRAPLVLHDDPTTLFTGSGMQPLLPYLLGADAPAGSRLGDSQTCLRAQDIDDVGDNRHTTFFEMLGNWSLGDYLKTEQIPMAVAVPDRRRRPATRAASTSAASSATASTASRATTRAPRSGRELFATAGISHERVDLGTEEHGNEVGNQGARIAFYGAEELVEPRRRGREDAGRRPRRPGLRGVLPLPAGRARHPRSARTATRTATAAGSSRSATRSSWSTARPRPGSPAAAAERRLRRRPGAHRRRLDRQPGRLPDQPAVADHARSWRRCPARPTRTRPSRCG